MRWPWQKPVEEKGFSSVLERIVAAQEGRLGASVTPENCMQSPTVHAIVTAISRRLAVTPIHVYRKTTSNGRDQKERLPNHPVTRLLQRPNAWQTHNDFWGDAASTYVRWGNFYCYKGRGSTGPIRELIPLSPRAVNVDQDENFNVSYRVTQKAGESREYRLAQMFHARGPGRNFVQGDSPVNDVQTAIALEILAEKFGATFFQNGAVPFLVFKFMQGSAGFRTKEEETAFIEAFQDALGGSRRFRAMLVPKGIDEPKPIPIENDKAQFLETRKYQRTVIAGAFGVPPHLVGDLERATFNNVEQQDSDFTLNVVMPVCQAFEAAMERDLLTDTDRATGVCIRFNLDSVLRADFKSRQEGLKIQREMGVINANEWREVEGKNPRDGGNDYWQQGPSGQNAEEMNDETESDSSPGTEES
jgi:HK97 family phage portal protein